ncbi:hypothetical protein L1887_32098 [Cichorium endivia]|nr:hypothetical protein L1887_32098 [Cichorium endivia]
MSSTTQTSEPISTSTPTSNPIVTSSSSSGFDTSLPPYLPPPPSPTNEQDLDDEPTTLKDVVESIRTTHDYTKERVKSLLDASERRILEHQAKLHAESDAKLAAIVQEL